MTFHRYVALGDSFTEGVGDPDPARPNGLRGWADRVAEVLGRSRATGLRLRQPRHPRPQARRDPRRAGRAGRRPGARPGHDLRRRQRHPAAPGRHRRPRRASTTPRSAGWPAPAPGCSCSRPSTRAARRSTGRCAAGSRSTTSWSARAPTGTARRRRLLADAGVPRLAATGTPTGCTSARPATSGWRSRCSTPSASSTRSSRCRSTSAAPLSRRRAARARTASGRADSAVPVGAPPAHRPLVGRRGRPRHPPWPISPARVDARLSGRRDRLACADPPGSLRM